MSQRAWWLLSWGFPDGQLMAFSLFDLVFARQQPPLSWPKPGGPLLQGSQSLLTESWWATVSIGSSKEGICDKVCMLLPQRKAALWGPELLSPASCQCPLGFHKDALFKESVGHVR